jgi:hypothetical protein
MKKGIHYLLFLLTFLTTHSNSFAQQVFPEFSDSAKWNVLECFWFDCYTATYSYEYDTTFCGHNYSKIHFGELNENGYFRSENLKTYFRRSNNCSDKEYLMYDYSLNIGDTAFVAYNLPNIIGTDTAEFVLDAIDTVNYFGIDRQRFKMLYDPGNDGWLFRPMYWIKGIGSETHPFYPYKCLMDGCEKGFQLLCYDSMAVQLYQNPWANDCDTTILGILESSNEITISPNPFTEKIVVSTDNPGLTLVVIYSSIGNKLLEIPLHNEQHVEIETVELVPGTYVLVLHSNDGIRMERIIKME